MNEVAIVSLSELITEVLEEENVNYSVLVDRAHAAGYTLFSKAHISQLVNREPKALPQPETLFAVAAALRKSPETILAAAAQDHGINIYAPDPPGGGATVIAKGKRSSAKIAQTRRRIDATVKKQPPR